jgi:hypothetical protein
MILPKIRDPRFITIRRGGVLTDEDHHLLAFWAASCAEHVHGHFETECPGDDRPRKAIEAARRWARGDLKLDEAKKAAWHANASARDLSGAAKFAALSAGQAAVVGHVAAHELGAAAYAIRAAMATCTGNEKAEKGRAECAWQLEQLPAGLRDLVIDDELKRDDIYWKVFRL